MEKSSIECCKRVHGITRCALRRRLVVVFCFENEVLEVFEFIRTVMEFRLEIGKERGRLARRAAGLPFAVSALSDVI